ncbi:MAG: hypothetical protein ABSG78_01010 [Verrucomicrobiota bacterium]
MNRFTLFAWDACQITWAGLLGVVFLNGVPAVAAELPTTPIRVDFTEYREHLNAAIRQENDRVLVEWPTSRTETGFVTVNLTARRPLIESIAVATSGQPPKTIARDLDPVTLLTIGERDMKNPAGWVAFFDDPMSRPHQTYAVKLEPRSVRVSSAGVRSTIHIGEVRAGSFQGELRLSFYRNSPLIHLETVVQTGEDGRAILYDTGLTSRSTNWESMAWMDAENKLQSLKVGPETEATAVAVSGRTLAGENKLGSIAVFPPPHQYFYPVDEVTNLKFVWYGKSYQSLVDDFGFGIRQSPTGANHFIPWFNAPPHTEQHLGVFYLLTSGDAPRALAQVAEYTHGDQFKKLPGYVTFSSHYHIEHTQEFVRRQKEQHTDQVPKGMEVPGFVKTFKARGVNIVHLAEFHLGINAPKLTDAQRLPLLKTLFQECERLSDDQLLVLPGEEDNVQLGGHWMSLFPKPVYVVLNRAAGQPFVEQNSDYGAVYHVGSQADVLQLMEREHGLMWTAHPRIKGSLGFPDKYKDRDFFLSDHFLGGAWKAMPADLSQPRLGLRVLDLMDEMANWGLKKQVLGEVDAFRMEPDFETYGHMNVNYLKMEKLPRFSQGWQAVLDTLRGGRFFVSTGEVLIPEFDVAGKESGQVVELSGQGTAVVNVKLEWTFPMAFAEVISGDGRQVYRDRVELHDTEAFGSKTFHIPVTLKGRSWVRFEAWDIAANGAFTQPVWLR